MARKIGKLSGLAVTRASQGYHGDGAGLYLLVGRTGGKSWVFRYRVNGRLREMGLGPQRLITLAEARQRALECSKQRLDGIDPIEARRARRMAAKLDAARAMTFKQCAEAYIAAHQAGWRNAKHAAQWPSTLGAYVYPAFGDLPVQAIDVGLVMKAIEPMWQAKPETASRVRGRIESVLDWATARGYRTGENPARWKGHLENLLPKKSKVRRVEHHAALPYGRLAEFLVELRSQTGVAARALEFAILTAARSGEVLGANWSEIDLAERLWTVPANRMKAGREHRVPLCDRAIEILEEMRTLRQSDYAFPGAKSRRPLGNTTLSALLGRMHYGHLTAHGFRSTFSDWCAESTNFPSEVREMALAHTLGDKVEAAYRRGDLFQKRRDLMAAWASFATAVPGGNVVPLAAAR